MKVLIACEESQEVCKALRAVLYPRVEQAKEIQGGDRGDDGFGSTGR